MGKIPDIVPDEPELIYGYIDKIGETVYGNGIPCMIFTGFSGPVAYIQTGKTAEQIKCIGKSLTVCLAVQQNTCCGSLPGRLTSTWDVPRRRSRRPAAELI